MLDTNKDYVGNMMGLIQFYKHRYKTVESTISLATGEINDTKNGSDDELLVRFDSVGN